MEVRVGQKVYVPDEQGNAVRGVVQSIGKPTEAIEVDVDGKAVKRDVAFVQHVEGEQQGFVAKVPQHQVFADKASCQSPRQGRVAPSRLIAFDRPQKPLS
jgi:hypothetical protein